MIALTSSASPATVRLLAVGALLLLAACSDDSAAPIHRDTRARTPDQYLYRPGDAGRIDGRVASDARRAEASPKADSNPAVCPGQGTTSCTASGKPGKCWAGSCCTGCYDGFGKKCYPPSSTVAICGNDGNACQTCPGNQQCVDYVCQ